MPIVRLIGGVVCAGLFCLLLVVSFLGRLGDFIEKARDKYD